MTDVEVFIPTAAARTEQRAPAQRLETLDGVRIGWLDNQKANAGELLSAVAHDLENAGLQFERVTLRKDATAAAPDAIMAHLKTCDAVVLAIAD